jgi:myo-inositol-1(or 4)-monophosphatase
MHPNLDEMREIAAQLAREAGRHAVARLDADNGIAAKGVGVDVVTEVDHACEQRIIAGVREAFPGHAITGEESGLHGDGGAPIHWLVDPLDGTNNYVMGMPMFGVCLTACSGETPLVAVVHDSMRDITTSAARGEGAFRNGVPVRMGEAAPLSHTTLSWSQGYAVTHDDPFRVRAMEAMERGAKRVLRTWSPSIDWGLLAAGHTGAFVLYRNEPWDLTGGLLIAAEAGGVVAPVPGIDCVIAGKAGTVHELLTLLQS